MPPIKCNLLSTSTKIRQYNHSTPVHICMTSSAICLELFLICSYTLREDAVETHSACRARCVHAVDAQWQLFERHQHAMSDPWPRNQTPVKTPWERGGTPWALLGNITVAVGAPWHLHVMENVKLFAIFSSIFVRTHGALRNFKSLCQRRGIAVECDRGLTDTYFHENVEKDSCVQGVKQNIPKIFQIVPCTKFHLPWKFYGTPFTRFS